MDGKALERLAFERRLDVLDMVYNSRAGHIGGSMSCMDILCALYYEIMDVEKIRAGDADRDRFIMSKGHCAEALYAVLADCGFFPKEELRTFARFDTRLPEHPSHRLPGIEIGTGSLGHGLGIAAGLALGLKRDKNPGRVYVLMGDGEQQEGTVWEAAMASAKYGLDNLMAIVDCNTLQISGDTEDIMPIEDLADKYMAFGWEVALCMGNEALNLRAAMKIRKKKHLLKI